MLTRNEVSQSLLHLDRPYNELIQAMSDFDLDDLDMPTAIVTRQDLISTLERYLSGELSADVISDWAGQLMFRSDFGFERGYQNILKNILNDLDNPPPLPMPQAIDYLSELKTAQFNSNEED
jgi:hypothetical protein